MPARPNIAALFNDEGRLLINFKVSASLENLFKNHLRSPSALSDGFLCSPGRAPPHTLSSPTRPLPSGVAVCHPAQHHTAILPWDAVGQVQSISVSPDTPVTPQEEGSSVMMKVEDGNDGWMGHKRTAGGGSPSPTPFLPPERRGKESVRGRPNKSEETAAEGVGRWCRRETYDRVKPGKVGGRLRS